MDEFAIIKPPKENPEAEIVCRKTDQKHIGGFQRRTVVRLLSLLNDTLQDAWSEIAKYPQIEGLEGRIKTAKLSPSGGGGYQELKQWELDLKARYEAWNAHMYQYSIVARSVCKRVCQDGESPHAVRQAERMDERTVVKLLQYGLNEYSILSGWGDQING